MERIIDTYLRDKPLKNKPLYLKQHAYTAGRSVDSAVHEVVLKIEKVLNAKQFALGAFLDIVGAFNEISESMTKATTDFGVKTTVSRQYASK